MNELDLSWKNPSAEQLAALHHVFDAFKVKPNDREFMLKRAHFLVVNAARGRALAVDAEIYSGGPHEMSVFDWAEFMVLAPRSLWYSQAKGWIESEDFGIAGARIDDGTAKLWRTAAKAVVEIVDRGCQDGKWWDHGAIWPDPTVRAVTLASIVDLCINVSKVARSTLAVHSAGFAHLPRLLLPWLNLSQAERWLEMGPGGAVALLATLKARWDPEFRKEYNRAKREAKEALRKSYEPIPCVKPDCDNPVAPKGVEPREGHFKNYRGTGACQAGHNSYWCEKCEKPHSFKSKIGEAHLEHSGGDFTPELRAKLLETVRPLGP